MHRLRQALAAAAIAALLLPLLTPLRPSLAAWSPDHDHVFAGGAPTAHAHPWDEGQPSKTARQPLHPCELHPPAGSGDSAEGAEASDAGEPSEVVFLFDPDVTGSALPASTDAALTRAGIVTVSVVGVAVELNSVVAPPASPPPKLPFSSAA